MDPWSPFYVPRRSHRTPLEVPWDVLGKPCGRLLGGFWYVFGTYQGCPHILSWLLRDVLMMSLHLWWRCTSTNAVAVVQMLVVNTVSCLHFCPFALSFSIIPIFFYIMNQLSHLAAIATLKNISTQCDSNFNACKLQNVSSSLDCPSTLYRYSHFSAPHYMALLFYGLDTTPNVSHARYAWFQAPQRHATPTSTYEAGRGHAL